MLSDEDITRRLPVWCALSDLFVDTELDPAGHEAIARALRASDLSPAQLDTILREEVAPVFHRNLYAGNWTGWPEAVVRELVTDHLARPPGWWPHLPAAWRDWVRRRQMAHFEADWAEVRRRLGSAPWHR